MPSTRRRFLAGVTALTSGVAGCNDRSSRSIDGTVTPVEVLRTDEEALREVTGIDAPSIPSSVVVTDDHLTAAVAHVERLRDSIAERLDAADGSVDGDHVRHSPESVLDDGEDPLEAAREAGPSEQALGELRRAVEDLARADGTLRAELEDVDYEALRAAIEAERTATDAFLERFDYRIARPVTEHLPTAAAAERWIDSIGGVDDAGHLLEDVESEEDPHPRRVGSVYQRLEAHRRRRDDAERYLQTATEPGAPSIRGAIDAELDGLDEELEAIADEMSELDGDAPDGETAISDLRRIRQNVGDRSARFRSRLPEYREDGRRLRGVFEGARRMLEFQAIDAGFEQTEPLARRREFPTARLLEAKRDAVESLGRAAEGTPLQRRFAQNAEQLLSAADRYRRRDAPETGWLVQMYLLYVGAAEWADRGLDRGEALSDSLQAQQS